MWCSVEVTDFGEGNLMQIYLEDSGLIGANSQRVLPEGKFKIFTVLKSQYIQSGVYTSELIFVQTANPDELASTQTHAS